MPPLKNQQHELFCLAICSGMSQQDAYIEAGYVVEGARFSASHLATNPNIIRRRGELSAKTETDTVMPVTARKERLSELAREDIKQPVTAKEVVQSIAELNKMDGSYAPEKHAIIGDILIEVIYIDRDKNKNTSRAASPTLPPG